MHLFTRKLTKNEDYLSLKIITKVNTEVIPLCQLEGGFIVKDETHALIATLDSGIETFLVSTTSGIFYLTDEISYIIGTMPFFGERDHPLMRDMYIFTRKNYNDMIALSNKTYNKIYSKLNRFYIKYYNSDNMTHIPYRSSSYTTPGKGRITLKDYANGKEIHINMRHGKAISFEKFDRVYMTFIDKYEVDHVRNYIEVIVPYSRTILSGLHKINTKLKGVAL